MKKQLLCLLLGVSAFSGYSQKVLWEQSVGGAHSEYLFDMLPTVDYGFLLAGSSLSEKSGLKKNNSQGSLDYFLWKMDKDGQQEWQLSFGGEGQDLLKSISQTSDVGYILGGYSDSGIGQQKSTENKGKNDLWIIKLDAKGGEQWQQSYGGLGDDRLVQIKQTSDGGYIIAATTNSEAGGDKKDERLGGLDYWIIKTDKKGVVEWERTFGGIYNDEPKTILETENGFVVGGVSNSPASGTKRKDNYGGYDLWILELDSKGYLIDEHVFGGTNDDSLNEILLAENKESYIITGSTFSESSEGTLGVSSEKDSDFILLQTDLNFQPAAQFNYDLGGSEILTSTTLTDNNNLLLSGFKTDDKTGKKSYVSIQVNEKGEQIWDKELSTNGDDLLRKAVVTRDGGFVFAGNSTGKGSKLKSSSEGRNDYWIVKLHTKDEIKQPEIKIEAFPNPTEGYTQVVVNHEYKEGVVNVYDITGRLLHTEPLKYDMVAVNLSSYATGTYVINIKTDVVNTSVKVIKK